LLNVILFPNMGCDQTGTAWNPLWIAVHSWASFRLATETPVQVHGTFRANEHRGTNLGCLDRAVLKQGQLKAADDSGDGLHYRLSRLDATNFQASLVRAPAIASIPRALNCRASCPI
jgi:hypothetical protein